MGVYAVELDPVSAISGRTPLNLNSGAIAVGGPSSGSGIDWGDAAVAQLMAESQWGSAPVSFRVPNRIISIPLILGAKAGGTEAEEEEARRDLNEKTALLQRQGGVVLRQREGAGPLYADIVNATLTLPDVWGETGAVEPNVVLKLETLPDWYGEEVTLDSVEQTGQIVQVLQQGGKPAVIAGDYPARTRIVLTEKAKKDQRGMLWGLRSTHYDSDPSAALFFDAYKLTPINGAVVTSSETFSGSALTIAHPEPNIWHPFMTTDILAGADQLTHVGSYRVWARVFFNHPGSLRLTWSLDDATTGTYNPAVQVAVEGWHLLDLGEIRVDNSPVGEHWWRGVLQCLVGSGAEEGVDVDRIWLQPVDDGAGRLRATGVPLSTLLSPSRYPTVAANAGEGTAWGNPAGATKTGEEALVVNTHKSQVLKLTTAGFAIPEGSTIMGIQVIVQGGQFPEFGGIAHLQLYKAGILTGTEPNDRIPCTTGSSTDLWGTTWTPAQINAAGFGVGISVRYEPTLVANAYVRGPVTIRVYYSYSSAAITEDAVLYSERQSEIRFDGAFREDTTTGAYVGVSQLTGDLPRLPPSGLEGRAVELFVKNSRSDLTPAEPDAGIDKVSAIVKYRPCFLGRI
jgi:hypothetical protein